MWIRGCCSQKGHDEGNDETELAAAKFVRVTLRPFSVLKWERMYITAYECVLFIWLLKVRISVWRKTCRKKTTSLSIITYDWVEGSWCLYLPEFSYFACLGCFSAPSLWQNEVRTQTFHRCLVSLFCSVCVMICMSVCLFDQRGKQQRGCRDEQRFAYALGQNATAVKHFF